MCIHTSLTPFSFFFFFNDTATTEIYTLSLHDALPISHIAGKPAHQIVKTRIPNATYCEPQIGSIGLTEKQAREDRKSTRLNSSHSQISYAVFCLKKKKNKNTTYCFQTY